MTKALSREPQEISKKSWYYEDRKGLDVYIECEDGKIRSVIVPWKMIWDSCERYNLTDLTPHL